MSSVSVQAGAPLTTSTVFLRKHRLWCAIWTHQTLNRNSAVLSTLQTLWTFILRQFYPVCVFRLQKMDSWAPCAQINQTNKRLYLHTRPESKTHHQ
ncbi:hypothetical protein XELAEV_18033070mg [Xenopus laevis]|uniref:Uncharacterized protein n=1 Tax=Xenopus laevis TaxID=8355 RepID=A0A974HDM3_XENLA|nr:hypothetical protein XELAEV_18033070mg [Xenopus laevis]